MTKKMIKYYIGASFALIPYYAAAADVHSIRHEIDLFFSSGVGGIVSIILLLLLLLWLLLPLAVFGLKRKLKDVIKESRETNKLLAEIKNVLTVVSAEETREAYTEQPESAANEQKTANQYDEVRYDP